MVTNLGVDPELVEEARQIGNHATKTAAIREALREYVQRHGRIRTVDAKAARSRKKR